MGREEGAGTQQVIVEDGVHTEIGGLGHPAPRWLGLGPAFPTPSGLGLQAASVPPSRPPESLKSNIPPPLFRQPYCH